ncbi:hypothetical protein BBO99_00000009 [Phytophthora kernoviae]|uniref:Uncharacterized protein n=1 Tax=Phytophthora kernoviae TaxID=325452 RepID=A0A421F7B7_9STRA|nr:hypothetical protein BBI17_000009 [Phytophthora kernoviae]RLN85952.1 hypothetical protein BBO99_00000009 [Phytophthora kernoviae]
MFSIRSLLLAGVVAIATSAATTEAALPVFFFHGATGNVTNGAVIEANLTADGRTYTALDFCSNECSVKTAISEQVQLAITQIRGIVEQDAAKYADGYHFLAHSQGGSVARGVIEEMDDHNVNTFISMAGDGNGNFFGPQASDAVPLQVLLQALGPYAIDATVFDFSKYEADSTSWKGKFQRDFIELVTTNKDLQGKSSIANIMTPPLADAALSNWMSINPFLPKVNNLQNCGTDAKCTADQVRRKANFVKLKAAHFFASPQDDVQAPWQSCVLGKYTTVASVDEIETKFADLTIVGMKDTVEYTDDLYGLKTLDTAGGLHIHEVADVPHNCWLFDYTSLATNVPCKHAPVYSAEIYPLLNIASSGRRSGRAEAKKTPSNAVADRLKATEYAFADAALYEELEQLRVELASKSMTIHAQREEIAELCADIDKLRVVEDKVMRKKHKISLLREQLSRQQAEKVEMVHSNETLAEKYVQLQEEAQFLRDINLEDASAKDEERLQQLELVQNLRARELALQDELEQQQKKWANDRDTVHQRIRLLEKEKQFVEDEIARVRDESGLFQRKHGVLQQEAQELRLAVQEEKDQKLLLAIRIEELEAKIAQIEALSLDERERTVHATMEKLSALETLVEEKTVSIKKADRQLNAAKLLARQAKKEKEALLLRVAKLEADLAGRTASS